MEVTMLMAKKFILELEVCHRGDTEFFLHDRCFNLGTFTNNNKKNFKKKLIRAKTSHLTLRKIIMNTFSYAG